ncbi:hypothetical protein ANN_22593 [Periplaneta americana]|uniref:PHD-type domain-containing protein n=1 Tax=Periplaneta americana TaxID=6978 RepID=A0ABQ8S8J6_PERAM|nr:hypothetical protein ANN_22593 [Periplaneta americana]
MTRQRIFGLYTVTRCHAPFLWRERSNEFDDVPATDVHLTFSNDSQWNTIKSQVAVKMLRETLSTFQVTNGELKTMKHKDEQHLSHCQHSCEFLSELGREFQKRIADIMKEEEWPICDDYPNLTGDLSDIRESDADRPYLSMKYGTPKIRTAEHFLQNQRKRMFSVHSLMIRICSEQRTNSDVRTRRSFSECLPSMAAGVCGACRHTFYGEKQSIACIGPCAANYHLTCANIDPEDREFFIVDGFSTYKCRNCTRRGSDDVCVTPVPPHRKAKTKEASAASKQDESDEINFESLLIDKLNTLKENDESILMMIKSLSTDMKNIAAELNLLRNENAALRCLITESSEQKKSETLSFLKPDYAVALTESNQSAPMGRIDIGSACDEDFNRQQFSSEIKTYEGTVKDQVYRRKPRTLEDLRQEITAACAAISIETLTDIAVATACCVVCLTANGEHFGHLK